jgi:hypothetical protein
VDWKRESFKLDYLSSFLAKEYGIEQGFQPIGAAL